MARKSIDLKVSTDPSWVNVILDNFDEFLCDHAKCERKASALAMSMVVKYPDRAAIIPQLISIAQEELEHFRQVYELMQNRVRRILLVSRAVESGQLSSLLELPRDADRKQVKRAYFTLSKELHPDRGTTTTDEFDRLHKAYQHLIHHGGRGQQRNPAHSLENPYQVQQQQQYNTNYPTKPLHCLCMNTSKHPSR